LEFESVQALGAAWRPCECLGVAHAGRQGEDYWRTPRADDGRKWAVTGSRAGLFYNPQFSIPMPNPS
jgi:hypothetical protein